LVPALILDPVTAISSFVWFAQIASAVVARLHRRLLKAKKIKAFRVARPAFWAFAFCVNVQRFVTGAWAFVALRLRYDSVISAAAPRLSNALAANALAALAAVRGIFATALARRSNALALYAIAARRAIH
jgi:hypothetical protein